MPMPTFPLAQLGQFRSELHACFTRRADALFELGDALLCAPAVPSLPHLSLEPVHRRGWGSAYAALACGRIEVERLRDLLASSLPPADPMVFAVDVTTWPRCDAECSPERGYYYHPSRHSAGQPIIAGWAFQWIAQVSLTATPGPLRSTRPGYTPWTTPTTRPLARSAPSSHGCPPVRPCRCLCSTAATIPPSSPWTWPSSGPRCWCGCGRTVAATLIRRQRRAHQGWPAAPPWRQVRLRRPGHLADPDRHFDLSRRPIRHRDRAGLEWAASQAAAPPRPWHPRTATDRARHDHPRAGRARPGSNTPAQGAEAVVVWPWRARPGPGLARVCPPVRSGNSLYASDKTGSWCCGRWWGSHSGSPLGRRSPPPGRSAAPPAGGVARSWTGP